MTFAVDGKTKPPFSDQIAPTKGLFTLVLGKYVIGRVTQVNIFHPKLSSEQMQRMTDIEMWCPRKYLELGGCSVEERNRRREVCVDSPWEGERGIHSIRGRSLPRAKSIELLYQNWFVRLRNWIGSLQKILSTSR